nr:MAG TPA: HeH/LEM domain [Caudoviricetes sp.]DAM73628.1 MAG TPA: HeH/LEM domain [Caudoviricetes sp.]DAU61218.1 MAG TPA: HeH/LEM domain [Caudoviricetes sp.]
MAMVNIMKGEHTVKVSRNSYETMFKKNGYVIVDETKQNIDDFETEEETVEDDSVDTIPISEMNKEQLAEYATKHNIDTSKAKNVREARQIIQKAIQQSKM